MHMHIRHEHEHEHGELYVNVNVIICYIRHIYMSYIFICYTSKYKYKNFKNF